jgi:hypothetical protein
VRDCSVTYRERLEYHPNILAHYLFQRPNYNRMLKPYYPADLATRFWLILCKIPIIYRKYKNSLKFLITSYYANCTGSMGENCSYHWQTSYSPTKQSWCLSGLMVYSCVGSASNSDLENTGNIPVENVTGNYRRTALCAKMRWYNVTYNCYRSNKKCETTVSPTDTGLKIIPTASQNLYFTKHTAIISLSRITLQIEQLDFD